MKINALLLFVVLLPYNAFCQWTQTSGPEGAQSREIFHAGNYLIVNSVNGGIYRSADIGSTWETVNSGLPPDFRCWAMDVDNDQLYIAASNGIFRSGDFGNTWTQLSSDIVAFSIEVSGNEIFAGYHNSVIYYSADGGDSWIIKNGPPVQKTVRQLLKFGGKLWLGNDSDFYSSSDNGATWDNTNLNLQISGLHTDGVALYASGNNGFGVFTVSRTVNQGASWTILLTTGENNIALSGFYKSGNEIFVSGASSFYYSDNDGLSWTSHVLLPGFTFYRESSLAYVNGALIISYCDGLLFSNDKGVTWSRRNTDFRNHSINKIMNTNTALVALSETNGVFVSHDKGGHWQAVHDRGSSIPQHIYAYGNAIIMSFDLTVYKSTDDGASWKKIFTLDITGANSIPTPHLSGFKQSLVLCTFKGAYLSNDMGETWNLKPSASIGTSDSYLKGFIQHDTVIVMAEREMFFSTNFGGSWKKVEVPEDIIAANSFVSDFIFDKTSIMMSTYNGLYQSSDFGTTWEKITCIPNPLIFDMAKAGETLILCTYLGVFASAANVAGWYPVRNGLGDARVLSILVTEDLSYAGTFGKSVWKIPTTQILTMGETIELGGEDVPTPIVEASCSLIKIINPAANVNINWYRDGAIIPNQIASTLTTTGSGSYTASFGNFCHLKFSGSVDIGGNDRNDLNFFNVITVNEDGKNDYYFVDEALIGSRLQVYNRWGEVVYSNESYKNDWSPDQIASGQYFYSIESKCFGSFKGTLSILKP